jgi:uncharacterized membrane protein
MHEWLVTVTEIGVVVIDAIAFLAIAFGTIQAVSRTVAVQLRSGSNHEKREIWLEYARWLVAGLTFQLAADIIETSISTSWEAIARLGAVAFIRTFLDFFLGRDVNEWRERERERERREGASEIAK